MSVFFKVGDEIVFRLDDEPEHFRFGRITEMTNEGIPRIYVEGIDSTEDEYNDMDIFKQERLDIAPAVDGWYKPDRIAYVYFVKEQKSE